MFERISRRRLIDDRGKLSLLEVSKELPFAPKRVFWVEGVQEGIKRGFHAHRTGTQVLFCMRGSIELSLRTFHHEELLTLDAESPGVWMQNMVWGEQRFTSEGTILLVLASNEFDESDYIRDFDEFMTLSKKRL